MLATTGNLEEGRLAQWWSYCSKKLHPDCGLLPVAYECIIFARTKGHTPDHEDVADGGEVVEKIHADDV